MILLFVSLSWAQKPCGTLDHLRQFDQALLIEHSTHRFDPIRSDKSEREGLANLSNSRSSDNFIVKWNGNVNSTAIDRLIDSFELAWQVQVEDMGHPVPSGSNEYLFNVYIGDSGGNAPSSGGAAGYFTVDNDYYPMIVVGKGTLENPEYADITAAHEFYHAVQGATFRFEYDEGLPGAWFWESTATWASAEVYPNNYYYASFLFSYALLPSYPVDYFNYPDTGTVDEYYQYGSFLFPLDISQQISPTIIRDAWLDSTSEMDPIEVIRKNLQLEGVDFNTFWIDHTARLTQFDFPNGDIYSEMVAGASSSFPELGGVIAAEHSGEGTGGWVEISDEYLPNRYGYARIELNAPSEASYQIAIEPDNVSNLGRIAFYEARAVIDNGSTLTYVDIPVDGESSYISGISTGDVVTLVVGAWSSEWSPGISEKFGFSYVIAPDEWASEPANEPSSEEPVVPDNNNQGFDDSSKEGTGCACSVQSSHPATLGGLLGLLMIWTRGRRTTTLK